MELLAWMLVGHMAGDFLFQTRWMALNKTGNLWALAIHSVVYAGFVTLFALPCGGLRWYSVLALAVSHMLLDQRAFTMWWCRHVTKSAETPWLVTLADQAWHAVFLAASCALTVFTSGGVGV